MRCVPISTKNQMLDIMVAKMMHNSVVLSNEPMVWPRSVSKHAWIIVGLIYEHRPIKVFFGLNRWWVSYFETISWNVDLLNCILPNSWGVPPRVGPKFLR